MRWRMEASVHLANRCVRERTSEETREREREREREKERCGVWI